MRLTRSLAVRLSLALTTAAGLASALGLGGVFSCSKYETYKDVPVDCTVQDPYEYELIEDFASSSRWWQSADYTPDAGAVANDAGANKYIASATVTATSMPDMCGNTTAGVFTASHNDDWGCVFGMWGFNSENTKTGLNKSMWHGLSFWARAPGQTTKAFTLILDDDNTFSVAKEDWKTAGTRCRTYPTDGGAPGQEQNGVTVTVVQTDPSSGTPITGSSNQRAAYPDECGNGFYVVMEVTSDWRLYTIPWREFKQTATPNRVPNEVLHAEDAGPVDYGSMLKTSGLRNLTLRMPKEAEMELWMTKLSYYREKAK